MRHDGADVFCKVTHWICCRILCAARLLCQEKDLALSIWASARQKQVYLLIFRLIKTDCDCRNILIFLISLLPLIITCKMGDVG